MCTRINSALPNKFLHLNSRNYFITMTATYHSFITGLASLLLVFCTNNDSVQAEESVDILSPAAFAEPHETVFSASTPDPISLHRGQVLETATDISLSTPVSELTYTRTYSSRLINDKDAAASLNGANWFGGLAGRYITPFEGGVRIRWDASSSRLFNERDGKFVPRGNFNASLQKRGEAAQEEYVMIQKDTDIVYVFYGFNNAIAEKVRGKIKEKTTRPLFVQGKKGDCFHYSEDTFGSYHHRCTAE